MNLHQKIWSLGISKEMQTLKSFRLFRILLLGFVLLMALQCLYLIGLEFLSIIFIPAFFYLLIGLPVMLVAGIAFLADLFNKKNKKRNQNDSSE